MYIHRIIVHNKLLTKIRTINLKKEVDIEVDYRIG